MSFLLQCYAPLDSVTQAYHRVLYLFCCRDCNTFKVFRTQLPKKNPYYKVVNEDDGDFKLLGAYSLPPTCAVCGCSAGMKCERCGILHYCSEKHRELDLNAGHDEECKQLKEGKKVHVPRRRLNTVFNEFEIVTEEEPTSDDEGDDHEEGEEIEDPQKSDPELSAVSQMGEKIDRAFVSFKKRLDREPEQILRYSRDNSSVLWLDEKTKMKDSDIPKCVRCGGDCIFEFQVIPSLIYFLKEDPIESKFNFGNLLVYTCAASCTTSEAYTEEFVMKQDINEEPERKPQGESNDDDDDDGAGATETGSGVCITATLLDDDDDDDGDGCCCCCCMPRVAYCSCSLWLIALSYCCIFFTIPTPRSSRRCALRARCVKLF
eukprot:TRINITY_DN8881_c1_g1_i1.p1 TRINITY_DN8881_c1_g1~~TRINITY_DN8881_c1_g1_i1.p1  ORF type:complete len:375 (+),score=106.66 TRINITY_DN8881_c1_g1_i1:263-1387(+)